MARARGWGFVLASTGIGSFVTSANLSTVNVAFPDLKASFEGESLASLGWVINAYTIAFAAILLPAGRLADSHGRRRTFFAGLTLFALGALITGAAPSLPIVIIGRTVQGMGGGLIAPASLGLLLEASPPDEITRSVALYGGITAVGVATGPTLGALIVDSAGWRWSFLLSLPIAFAAWFVGRNHLSRARGAQRQRVDAVGVVLAAVAMAAVSLAIAEGGHWGWMSVSTLAAFAAGLVAGAWFVLRCQRRPDPVLPMDLFRVRAFSLSTSATVLFGVGTGALLLANVLFLTEVWNYSIVRAGLAMSPSPIVAALAAPLVGRFGARLGERTIGVPGALILASAVLWFRYHVDVEPNYWTDWFPGAVMAGLGINTAFPMLQSAGVRDVGAARFSIANASTRAALQLGTAVGVAVLVAILGDRSNTVSDFRAAWLMIAIFSVTTALLIAPIPRVSRPTDTLQDPPGSVLAAQRRP
ncbi:MAG TPA: MFS transporter [Acidimicrobiales bacterium]|nr:MFS transporter [Acidimicrobiales bacterium]